MVELFPCRYGDLTARLAFIIPLVPMLEIHGTLPPIYLIPLDTAHVSYHKKMGEAKLGIMAMTPKCEHLILCSYLPQYLICNSLICFLLDDSIDIKRMYRKPLHVRVNFLPNLTSHIWLIIIIYYYYWWGGTESLGIY
jgi:hypothetical protein